MPSITLNDIPLDLHAQLEREAVANFRSLDQEVIARIQRSFQLDERLSTRLVNQLIDEAFDSGPDEPISREKFDGARTKARERFGSTQRAA